MSSLLRMIAAVGMTVPLLSSCIGGNTKNVSNIAKEVSVSVFDRGTVPNSEGSYTDNRWTRWINEQSGINVTWVPVARNQAQQKLNMLIASGEAPDLIVEYDANYISQLINNGIVQPIDSYVEQYSTVYKKYLEDNPVLRPYVTFDGKMYAFTSKRSIDGIANHGLWIRQDWLDALNLNAPSTVEEFIDVARAFANNDPDGNSKNDTMGISMWQDVFSSMFMVSTVTPMWYLEDGQLVYSPLTDRYADYLGFVKQLYDEKLIDNEFFTDKGSKNQTQFWVTGKAGILAKGWNEGSIHRELLQNNKSANPVPLEVPATKYGRNGLWQETDAFRYAVLSTQARNPQAAVEFLDWMLDKGWFTLRFGEEGVHHRLEDGIPQVIDVEKNKIELDYISTEYPILSQWSVKPEWFPIMAAKDEVSQEMAKQRAASLETALKNKFRRDIPYAPPIPEFTKMFTEFSPKNEDIRMKVILGGDQYSPEWGLEQIRNEWKKLGGDEVDRAVNEWYSANKTSLALD